MWALLMDDSEAVFSAEKQAEFQRHILLRASVKSLEL